MLLEAVPNVSEGRDRGKVGALVAAFDVDGVELWDVHTDADHNRSVVTIAGAPERIDHALLSGARQAVHSIDMTQHTGVHPCVGALDVAPVVYLREEDRHVAHETALGVARGIGEQLQVPVFLYGELAGSEERRRRSFYREGGLERLGQRLVSKELVPDFGPPLAHPTAGVTLVAARPPLVAFNIELETDDLDIAKEIASQVREGGAHGLAGLRVIGAFIEARGRAQVSTNIERPFDLSLATVLAAVGELSRASGTDVAAAEVVGLAPAAALADFPAEVELLGFDPEKHLIENRMGDAAD